MRPTQIAILAIGILFTASVPAQESPAAKAPPARIDYSILAQPAHANRVTLSDQQRAKIAEILDTRVNDLVAADPEQRDEIVAASNAQIEALLSDEQKATLAESLTGGKLQFSFHKQKWSAVLIWFAQQADLSLVMDKEPPGLFTYNDTREFTPAEAIDLLNSVLLSKNFTLIRRERMLIVVDTSTGVPYDLVQQVPLEKLSEYGRFEIVTTEFPLAGRPLEAVVQAVTPLVGTHGQVIPLAAAGKILVTETAGRLKAINVVIASVPIPPNPPAQAEKPPAPIFKTYPAPGLEPETTTEVLRSLFPTATVKFDPNAQVIHCLAPPLVQTDVEASIAKLVESVSGDNRARLKTYKVPAKQLTSLVEQIALAHPEIAIASDPDKNRLLIVATAQQHADVSKTLESLGATSAQPSESEASKLVLYPVDAASIQVVTSILADAIPGALVAADVDRVAVRGTDEEQELARNTIAPFGDPPTDAPSLSFYPLEDPLSSELLAVLTAAIPEATIRWLAEEKKLSVLASLKIQDRVVQILAQIKQQGSVSSDKSLVYYPVSPNQKSRLALIQGRLTGELSTMLLITDSAPGEVIGWGTERQHQELKSLLENLKKNEPTPLAEPTKLDVTVAAPAELLSMLQTRFPETEMVFNEHTHALHVWAAGEQLELIRSAFEKISATLPPREESVMIPYALRNADASEVLALLMTMRPELKAAADAHSNRILVSAPLSQQTQYKVLIDQLDSEPNEPNEPKVESYALKSIAPATALSVLSPLFPELTLTSDTVNNRIVASGVAHQHQRLVAAIERIDVPAAEKDSRLESYDLKDANATQIVSVLAQLAPTAIASPSADGSRLFVWGDQASHRIVKQAMEHLTTSDQKHSRSMKAYPLPKGAGLTAVTIMQPVAIDAKLSLDAKYENLIAWATEQEHQAIATAIEGLQQDLVESNDKSTRVYRFRKSTPSVAYGVLITLVPEATLAIDATASLLVATASIKDHERIQTVVTQIEDESGSPQSMKAYPLPKGAGPTAITFMRPVAPGASLSLDASYENLIAWASEAEHQRIAQAVEGLRNDLVHARNKSTVVYRFEKGTPSAAYTVLTTQVPNATLAVDLPTSVLVASATIEEHELINSVVLQIEADPKSTRTMKAYPLPRGASATAVTIMQPVAADASFSLDETQENLIAWATDSEHKLIGQAVESLRKDLVNPDGKDQTVAVYSLDPELISAASLVETLDNSIVDRLSVQANVETNSLIVSGGQEAQAKFAETIETITSQLKKTNELQTQVYRFDKANPSVAQDVLKSLLPDATFAIDEATSVLVATATARQHESILAVVKQIDTEESAGGLTTEVYRLHRGSARTVYQALEMMTPKAQIGFDTGSNAIIATASAEDHKILKDAVSQLEGRTSGGDVKVYRLNKVRASLAASAIQSIVDGQSIEADVQANEENNSLVVVAEAAQQSVIEQAIRQLDSDDRMMEVFELLVNDPYNVQRSVTDMFSNMPPAAQPQLTVDFENGKLFAYGSKDQVAQISELLVKMGEPLPQRVDQRQTTGTTRTIRFSGNTQEAIQQLQTIWPKLRKNKIQVITPSEQGIQPIVPSSDSLESDSSPSESLPSESLPSESLPSESLPSESAPSSQSSSVDHSPLDALSLMSPSFGSLFGFEASRHLQSTALSRLRDGRTGKRPGRVLIAAPLGALEPDSPGGRVTANAEKLALANGTQLVVFQNTTRAPEPADDQTAQATEDSTNEADNPPVMIVTHGDSITISSEDTEALDRMESLLKAMAGSPRGGSNHANFAVFLLRNTGAADTKDLLEELFEALPFHHGGGLHETVVVSDDRLNAIIVHGNRQAREMVGQLLEVLDSQGLPDPLNVYKSEIFEFKHMHVSRAIAILENVYKPQLSPGLGKKPIEVPEGVSTTVESVLAQINASSRGPLLTLDMDEATNSLIMRAPPELRDEIRQFAEELDAQGATNTNRSVRVIQLKRGKSDVVQTALEQIIGDQPVSSRRRPR